MSASATQVRRLLVTPGEPAGIGPDLVVALAQSESSQQRVIIADPDLLAERARMLGLPLHLLEHDPGRPALPSPAACVEIVAVQRAGPTVAGVLDSRNSAYVVETLRVAAELMQQGRGDALVTGPVHKGIINEAGIAFSGHTEFFAAASNSQQVVMMLAVPDLRVALVTTHLPLSQVAAAINAVLLRQTVQLLDQALRRDFGLMAPRISVLGLNPHAGEGGHLGREELDIIIPVMQGLREQGLRLIGPLPADTAFTPASLAGVDAVLAMYHDQGLPVLKARGFGSAVNITLGLPWIRTSVDHGTALDLAGTGRAHAGSLAAAVACAEELLSRRAQAKAHEQ